MLVRPDRLDSKSYKIKPPIIDEAIYIIISDALVDGVMRPVEIFIQSKNMESFQWISIVTRLISHDLKVAHKFPRHIIKELKDTQDTNGGYIIPKSNGRRANSIVAHIGFVLEDHCKELGLI